MEFKCKDVDNLEIMVDEISYIWPGSIYESNGAMGVIFTDGEMLWLYYKNVDEKMEDYNTIINLLKENRA